MPLHAITPQIRNQVRISIFRILPSPPLFSAISCIGFYEICIHLKMYFALPHPQIRN